MKLTGSKSALHESTRKLLSDWNRTKETWRDHKAKSFDQTYFSDLNERVTVALRAMEDLDRLLAKIHNDCK